ncbi:MAG: DUF2272 domain-containing protein [Hyphomonadaceae bacterium]
MRLLSIAAASLTLTTPALAQSGGAARGALEMRAHTNGMQHPHYEARADQTCAAAPIAGVRQRLVDLAVQEWARFGYRVSRRAGDISAHFPEFAGRDFSFAPYDENDPLLMGAIGGYWAALTDAASSGVSQVGAYEIARQNIAWANAAGEYRQTGGWATPWSAAFISWVMCEAGAAPFRFSWAHRDYVDASIAAVESDAPHLYRARAPDQTPRVGDLLCAHRAGYRTDLAARREQAGAEGEMHCDLVVAINGRDVLAIGGNVENGVTAVRYDIHRGLFRTRIRSFCAPDELCRAREERLFALLTLAAPEDPGANVTRAPHFLAPPERAPPRIR